MGRRSKVIMYPTIPLNDEQKATHAIRLGYRAREIARYGIDSSSASDALAGTELGRMRLARVISQAQYWAGEHWSLVCHRHSAIMGYRLARPRGFNWEVGSRTTPEADLWVVSSVRDQWNRYHAALKKVNRLRPGVAQAVFALCINDLPQPERLVIYGLETLLSVGDGGISGPRRSL